MYCQQRDVSRALGGSGWCGLLLHILLPSTYVACSLRHSFPHQGEGVDWLQATHIRHTHHTIRTILTSNNALLTSREVIPSSLFT